MRQKNSKGLTIFFPYRSFHNLQFDRRVLWFFLLPPLFNILLLIGMGPLVNLWVDIIKTFLPYIDPQATIGFDTYHLPFVVNFPYIISSAGGPDAAAFSSVPVFCVILLILSIFIPDSFTPLKYFFRVFILVLLSAVAYFYFFPNMFPYNISIYSEAGLASIIAMMFISPWIFAFSYYMFSYKFTRKFILTAGLLCYFAILGPFQYLLNVYIIHTYSLLYMPVLYLYGGILINICILVSVYAYGASKEQELPKYKN